MQLPIKHVLTLSTFSVPLDPPNLFHGKLQILATAIMSSIYQVITFVGSYIVVCISAAFLITAIAEILWGEIWSDDSDEEEEDGSDDDWHFLP